MNAETVTVSKAKVEDLERRIDAIGEEARKCLQSCERILKAAKGE